MRPSPAVPQTCVFSAQSSAAKGPKWLPLLVIQYSRVAAACQGLPPEQSGALCRACHQPSPIPERGVVPRSRPAEEGCAQRQVDGRQQECCAHKSCC